MTMLTSKSQKGKGEDDDEVIKDSGNDFFIFLSSLLSRFSLSITTVFHFLTCPIFINNYNKMFGFFQ